MSRKTKTTKENQIVKQENSGWGKVLVRFFAALLKLYLTFFKLVFTGFSELSMAFWRFVEMYAHDRAQGKRFDWSKLLVPQPVYYKIGIDLNLLQFLWDWKSGNGDFDGDDFPF